MAIHNPPTRWAELERALPDWPPPAATDTGAERRPGRAAAVAADECGSRSGRGDPGGLERALFGRSGAVRGVDLEQALFGGLPRPRRSPEV